MCQPLAAAIYVAVTSGHGRALARLTSTTRKGGHVLVERRTTSAGGRRHMMAVFHLIIAEIKASIRSFFDPIIQVAKRIKKKKAGE